MDCGSSKSGNPATVRKYLVKQLGAVPELDWVVITHPDKDHYNYLPQVLENIPVGKVFLVDQPSEFPEGDCEAWLDEFAPADRIILDAASWNVNPAKQLIPDQGGARVSVLAANVEDTTVNSEKNTRSIVLKVTFNNFDAILTGDATFDTENDIMNRFTANFLDVELLKIGHHGSRATSTSSNWAAKVKPEIAVVSSAYSNSYGHPASNVIARLEQFTEPAPAHKFRWYNGPGRPRNITSYTEQIYCTGRNGNVVVKSDGTNFDVRSQ